MRNTTFLVFVLLLSACVVDESDESSVAQEARRPPSPPAEVTYWVDASSTVTRKIDGSIDRPFRTIGQALAKADAVTAGAVTVRVKNGTYYENVDIHRPTTIIGESEAGVTIVGSVQSWAYTRLALQYLTITADLGAGVDGTLGGMGAIFVGGPCESFFTESPYQLCPSTSETTVSSVTIWRPHHWGIRQAGGTLAINDVDIMEVQTRLPRPFNLPTGTALHVTYQASATVDHMRIAYNPQGILLDDSTMRLWDENLVRGSLGVVPGRAEIAPAIEVRNGATLIGGPRQPNTTFNEWILHTDDSLDVFDNHGAGIAVFSATADLTHVTVSRTKTIPGTPLYAVNFYLDGGTLRLGYFESYRPDLVGLVWQSGSMQAHDGSVEWGPIGAAIGCDCSSAAIRTGVLYYNDVNIQLADMSLPPLPALP